MWWIVPMVVFGGLVMLIGWACLAAASRADDQIDEWLRDDGEPRHPVTGQPLTIEDQYQQECE